MALTTATATPDSCPEWQRQLSATLAPVHGKGLKPIARHRGRLSIPTPGMMTDPAPGSTATQQSTASRLRISLEETRYLKTLLCDFLLSQIPRRQHLSPRSLSGKVLSAHVSFRTQEDPPFQPE